MTVRGASLEIVPPVKQKMPHGMVVTWNAGPEFGPKWYPLSLVATALPCAWFGGWLHAVQSRVRRKE